MARNAKPLRTTLRCLSYVKVSTKLLHLPGYKFADLSNRCRPMTGCNMIRVKLLKRRFDSRVSDSHNIFIYPDTRAMQVRKTFEPVKCFKASFKFIAHCNSSLCSRCFTCRNFLSRLSIFETQRIPR